MALEEQVKQAFFTLIGREDGNLRQIALQRGVDYAVIHRLRSGKSSFSNMPISTIDKLFPNLRVSFGPIDDGGVFVRGANHGAIANGTGAKATVSGMKTMPSSTVLPADAISRNALEKEILTAEEFSTDERVRFLLFLKSKIT